MAILVGDEIIWCGQLTDPGQIRGGRVTKVRAQSPAMGGGLIWVEGQHKAEDCIYEAYCWPARVRGELEGILAERQRLQKAADDSMKLVYELRNAITRGEK